MNAIDRVLAANRRLAPGYDPHMISHKPRLGLAVLTCMDPRLSLKVLGLKAGDAQVIRNAGGIVTDDAVRSLLISHYVVGTESIMIINHTDCGMMKATDEELRQRIERAAGRPASTPVEFFAFQDAEENVRKQVAKLVAHNWIPAGIVIRGFVFDVMTGQLREVPAAPGARGTA
jgi:carbonic anhydrase